MTVTAMSAHQARAWRFFTTSLLVCLIVMYSLAYLLPGSIAHALVTWVYESRAREAISPFVLRFRSYASPSNAMVGLMAGWLLSPLLFAAGYRFMSDIVRTSGPRLRSRRKLIVRALVGLLMLAIFLFTTVALAGRPSGRCLGCEAEPPFLMLTVYWIGITLSGAMLGGSVSDVRAAVRRQDAQGRA